MQMMPAELKNPLHLGNLMRMMPAELKNPLHLHNLMQMAIDMHLIEIPHLKLSHLLSSTK